MRKPHIHLTNVNVFTPGCTDKCRETASRAAELHVTHAARYVEATNGKPARVWMVRGTETTSQLALTTAADSVPLGFGVAVYWTYDSTIWLLVIMVLIFMSNLTRLFVKMRAGDAVEPPASLTEGTTFTVTAVINVPGDDDARLRMVEN